MVASGKSTYARDAARRGVLCINDDAIYSMIHGGDYTLYDPALKPLYKSIENHALAAAILAGRDVLIDRGLNVSVAARQRWLSIARSFDVPCEAIVFPRHTSEVHAHRRYDGDHRGLSYEHWLRAARRHAAIYVEPTTAEGFTVIRYA
jgi:hypothetical protein